MNDALLAAYTVLLPCFYRLACLPMGLYYTVQLFFFSLFLTVTVETKLPDWSSSNFKIGKHMNVDECRWTIWPYFPIAILVHWSLRCLNIYMYRRCRLVITILGLVLLCLLGDSTARHCVDRYSDDFTIQCWLRNKKNKEGSGRRIYPGAWSTVSDWLSTAVYCGFLMQMHRRGKQGAAGTSAHPTLNEEGQCPPNFCSIAHTTDETWSKPFHRVNGCQRCTTNKTKQKKWIHFWRGTAVPHPSLHPPTFAPPTICLPAPVCKCTMMSGAVQNDFLEPNADEPCIVHH